jgi:hypothetical protein
VGRQLLIDSAGFKLDQLQEDQTGEYIFRGKFAQSDLPTANKRIYPRSLWEREINRLKTKISEGKVFGELDHPEDGKTKLQRSAILIQSLALDKQGQVIGSFKVLNTSMGRELKAIVEGGGAVGVSSRGYGSVRMNEDGHSVVQDDFTLLTFDPVADPAEETAYPELQKPETAEAEEKPADEELSEPEQTDEVFAAWQEASQQKFSQDSETVTEEISRNKLQDAIKKAKSIYIESSRDMSHKDALSRAVEEGMKLIGKQYDAKDFSIRVAAEVMTVSKKPTMEDVEMGQQEILNLIRSTVQESMDHLLAEKESVISESKQKLTEEARKVEALTKELSEAKQNIEKLSDVAKELGFGLYLQQHLGRHPKLKQIKESLGDLCLIESLEDLQNKIKVHISEVARIMEAEEAKSKKLVEQTEKLMEEKKLLQAQVQDIAEERDEAISIGIENAAALYLERRIQGNPYQTEIRKRFAEMKVKTKQTVEGLLSEYKGRRVNESSDFHRVRRSLSHRPKDVEHDSLVENHVKDTQPAIVEETLQLNGEVFNMNEIKRLAGIK